MSRIKFRGKRVDNSEWIYGYYCQVEGKHYIIPDSAKRYAIDKNDPGFYGNREVVPETVGQLNGLKDKSGKEIYFDSDIVEYTYTIENDVEISERTIRGVVVLDLEFTNSLCVKTKGGLLHHFTASNNKCLEVIDNIHKEKSND